MGLYGIVSTEHSTIQTRALGAGSLRSWVHRRFAGHSATDLPAHCTAGLWLYRRSVPVPQSWLQSGVDHRCAERMSRGALRTLSMSAPEALQSRGVLFFF